MKRLSAALGLLVLLGVTTTVKAAQCRINGGPWQTVNDGGTISLTVPVNVQLSSDPTRIILEGARLECRYTPNIFPEREDYWRTTTLYGPVWTPGAKFTSQGTGLRINGVYRNSPVADGILLATMPDNGTGYPINVTPYILVRNNPSNPIDVWPGDTLGTLALQQTNNYSAGTTRLFLRYTALNRFGISPSTCTINNNNPIEINFGDVHQLAIGTDPLSSSIRTNRTLTYACPDGGINTDITITYKGTPSSFNANLLTMSNPDVGTALVRAGAAVPVNGAYRTRINNSTGSDTVTFSLVKRAGSVPGSGPIVGSGVLVMGVP